MSELEPIKSDIGGGVFNPWPDCTVHVEWGQPGVQLAANARHIVVLVDVLSFSTSLSIACNRGATVLVYSLAELEAMGGRTKGAEILKAQNIAPDAGRVSLSPMTMLELEKGARVLATSLNGAHCVSKAAGARKTMVGTLRNRRATAGLIVNELKKDGKARVTIVPCGELWSSVIDIEGWRPGIEDWLGAGAISDSLEAAGVELSREALFAAEVFRLHSNKLADTLLSSVSGRELIAKGYRDDVLVAAELDTDSYAVTRTTDTEREFNATDRLAYCAPKETMA